MFQFFTVVSPLLFHGGKVFPFVWSQSSSCKHPIVWDPKWPNTTEGNPKEIDCPHPKYGIHDVIHDGIHDVIHDHSITFSVATFPNRSSPRWTAKLGGFLPDKATSRAEPVTWRLSRGNPSGIHQFPHVVEKQEKVMQSCQCETKLLPAMKGVAIKSTCMSRRLLLDIWVIFTITFYWVKQAGLKSLAALALFWKGLDLSQTGYVAISLANFWNNWVKQPIPISWPADQLPQLPFRQAMATALQWTAGKCWSWQCPWARLLELWEDGYRFGSNKWRNIAQCHRLLQRWSAIIPFSCF